MTLIMEVYMEPYEIEIHEIFSATIFVCLFLSTCSYAMLSLMLVPFGFLLLKNTNRVGMHFFLCNPYRRNLAVFHLIHLMLCARSIIFLLVFVFI